MSEANKTSAALTAQDAQNATRLGLGASIGAYTIWGFLPIYFTLMKAVPSTEVLAHRILWAVPFGALLLTLRHQWSDIKTAFKQPSLLLWLCVSAAIIAVNWVGYIWAVQNSLIFEASLGYYINPLMYVLAGVILWGEKLRRLQIFAVILAALGVSILTIHGGKLPFISLLLAISFTLYGLIRKKLDIGSLPGLFIETIWLLPITLIYITWLAQQGQATFGSENINLSMMMVLSGPITVVPLVCFAIGAKLLPLSTLGFLQYLGPTLQFFIGLYFGEKFTIAHALCFTCIWIAVAIFTVDMWQNSKRNKNNPQ